MSIATTGDRPPRKMGRPSKFTPELAAQFIEAIEDAQFIRTACALVGIADGTVYRWLQEADRDDAPDHLREFRDSVRRAQAVAEVNAARVVRTSMIGGALIKRRVTNDRGRETVDEEFAPPDGRLALEYLSRVAPHRYGRRAQLDVNLGEHTDGQVTDPEDAPSDLGALAEMLHRHGQDADVIEGEIVADDGQRNAP